MSNLTLLSIGMTVVSADGSIVGTVSEVRGNRLEIRSDSGELWLRSEAVDSIDGSRIHLSCNAGQLYRHIATPPAPVHSH